MKIIEVTLFVLWLSFPFVLVTMAHFETHKINKKMYSDEDN